jgi:signal peptidase I
MPQTIGIRPPRTPRESLGFALALSAIAVAANQVYYLFVGHLSITESYLGSLVVPVFALSLLLLASRWERRPLRSFGFFSAVPLSTTIAFVSLLTFLYLALSIDPGFVFGFSKLVLPPPLVFGFFLLSAPLIALAEVGLFANYAFRTFARSLPLPWAAVLSAVFFAGFGTDAALFGGLAVNQVVEYFLLTTVVGFTFGLTLALYCYKARWSLLGPVILASAIVSANALLPVGVRFSSWEVDFVSTLVAYTVLLIVVGIGLQESRLQSLWYLGARIGPRRHRFRDRARERVILRETLAGGTVVAIAVFVVIYGLPVAFGTPASPFLGIATGSMVPTFHRGEFVAIEHVAPTAIRVGTIIAFSVSCLPSPTVHRVIRIVSQGPNWVYQTKGDANPAQDPCPVPYSHVLGAVVLYLPYLGFLILDPLLAAGVVALIIIAGLLWRTGHP